MKKGGTIELAINYIHNPFSCQEHQKMQKEVSAIFPRVLILNTSGRYDDSYMKIRKLLDIDSAEEIVQILSQDNPHEGGEISLNLLEIKKILGYSYGAIYKTVQDLKKLKIVKLVPGKSKRGRKDIKVTLNSPQVKITHITKENEEFRKEIQEDMEKSKSEHLRLKEWLGKRLKEIITEPTNKKSVR